MHMQPGRLGWLSQSHVADAGLVREPDLRVCYKYDNVGMEKSEMTPSRLLAYRGEGPWFIFLLASCTAGRNDDGGYEPNRENE